MARASSPGAEPFPPLNTSADHQLRQDEASAAARRRRVSSGLGSSLRVGDTGAPGLATSLMHLQGTASQSRDATTKRSSKRRKARSALRRARSYAIKHTWVIPLAILAIFGLVFAVNPTQSNPVSRFIFLSYKIEPTSPGEVPQYGKGLWDIAFVSFYTVVLSFTREFIMQEVLRPLAKKAGLKSRAKQSRFMEQAYTAIYFGFLGPAGMYIMSRTPVWYFNVSGMYEAFPHKTHEAIFKFYYLFQAAYWAQQAIVMLLGMEEPRKDFKELIAHHIVSLALIGLSYRFHFTYMGLAVYITHDISDFFLATSKTLNYIDHWLIGPYYGLFCCVWIYMRHYLNIRILLSLFNEFKTVGPYELNWETGQYKCDLAFWITGTLLSSLQALNLFWLFYILRIAYRFVVHNVAKDDRSDEDESEAEVEAEAAEEEDHHKDGKSYAAAASTAISQNGNVKKR
ncbi:TLC domain-containing protein [Rhypophila decipiens]|uniref:TLC domain-containing protein n=1 Tax=Rhypophila decipiens TaxID=261697 RepID=A0AAN6YEX1_9PEZI|nr:TLC domain-containing protein [Rhypophila decipiens]